MHASYKFIIAILFSSGGLTAFSAAQIPGFTSSTPASTPATPGQVQQAPPDPLGRDNPRGCVLGFIRAAQEERYAVAAQYFEPPSHHMKFNQQEEEELAEQLLAILNQKFAGPLDFLSRDPQGRLDDGLPEDHEKVNSTLGSEGELPIFLVRREDMQGRKLWYFSRTTLDEVPQVYEALQFPQFEKRIPKTLVENRWLYMPVWQWLAMIIFIPIALLLGRLLTLAAEYFIRAYRKARHFPVLPANAFLNLGPATLAFAVLLHYSFVSSIGTSLLYRIYYRRVIWVFLAIAFYWILTRITRAVSARIAASFTSRGMLAERSIVSLLRRFVEVVIFLFVALVVLHGLGVDVSTALAGVGIGGLALGLGAQKTFENMFGGISVLFDKVIQVGDPCKINNQTGVVEDIGLRSTRLRTTERTLLTVPNGTMATATIENLRFRDKFLCQQTIRLRYDLSPDHIRFVLQEIRQLFLDDPKVEDASARVQFVKFAEYALELEIFLYILEPDYASYLKSQEELFLKIMDILEKYGVVLALPTQTTFVTQDSWIDPTKSKNIQVAIDKARDASGAQKPLKTLPYEE
ncbi:MAG TPA: mechanosensitive ion channel domain-containing protein [Candidatus Acidoferrum sp.]|jgi:MscS family membrane protein